MEWYICILLDIQHWDKTGSPNLLHFLDFIWFSFSPGQIFLFFFTKLVKDELLNIEI